jgi:UDP-hydrolysing UDP-N-acetyl-D-glucosamine 2-epimerase
MNILLITGSRADKGALDEVHLALDREHDVHWCHLAQAVKDTPADVTRIMSLTTTQVGAELENSSADLVIVHGDRFEILSAASAAYVMGKPIAHVGGGDVTEGSKDDGMRHATTKLAHLHFTSCESSTRRVLQLGEEPWRVHTVGCPGVDSLLRLKLLDREDALRAVDLPHGPFVLVTFHPNTMGDNKAELVELTKALEVMCSHGINVFLTAPNKDPGFNIIDDTFTEFFRTHKGVRYHRYLPRLQFLSLLKHCTAFIGNSSAGFYEAPTFGTPVINIGDRQKGRTGGQNIITCWAARSDDILWAFDYCRNLKITPCNHYGDGQSANRIAQILKTIDLNRLLRKRFQTWGSTKLGKIYTRAVPGEDTQTNTSSDGLPATTSTEFSDARLSS